jgi:hypothetical protein
MRNPYLVTLVVVTVICAIVGLSLYIAGAVAVDAYGAPDLATRLALRFAGTNWLTFAGFSFLATLVLGGILWNSPAARPARPPSRDLGTPTNRLPTEAEQARLDRIRDQES